MKLAKKTVKSALLGQAPTLNKILLGSLIAGSFLVGCSSVEQKPNENPEPAVQQTEVTKAAAQTAEKETEKTEANADALMATLVKPTEEPVTGDEVEQTAEPIKQKVAKAVKKKVSTVKPKSDVTKVIAKPKVENPKVVKKIAAKTVKAKKAVASSKKLSTKPLSIRSKDLPITYDIWQLKQGEAVLEKGIVVSTPTWEMGKEGYMSQIWLTLMEDQILVNSSSDIDQTAGAVGVKINGGDLIPFTRIEDHNIGVLEGKWLDQLKGGGKMDIFLGFFPGKRPQSKVFKTDVSLDSLSRVVPTYRNLLK